MNPAAALFRCPAVVGVLMTAACTIDPRDFKIVESDGAAGAGGQGGTSSVRDASQEASDAHAGSGGAGGGTGSGGAAGAGATGGRGGTGGTGGAAGGAGLGGGGVAGIAGAAGAAGIAGAGGAAGIAGAGGTGATGGSGGGAGSGTGGSTGGSGGSAGGSGGTTGGAGGLDAGTTGGTAGQTGRDARDIWFVDTSGLDGGVILLFEEDFESGDLGAFTVSKGCGTPPRWINESGSFGRFARAEAPATLGVNSIISPTIPIPGNVSNIRLRMFHQVVTQEGHDGAQVLVSVNSGPLQLVTNFTPNGYANGASVHPDTCAEGQAGDFDAWSGNLQVSETEANLSAAPYNIGAGDTVAIRFRMLVDSSVAIGGWDIEWVRLTGTVQ